MRARLVAFLLGPAPASMLLRLALSAAVLIPLAVVSAPSLTKHLLPAYRVVFEAVAPEFDLTSFATDHAGADRVLRATVRWKGLAVIGGRVVDPHLLPGSANSSTLIAHGLQGGVVALMMAMVWPAGSARGLALRLLLVLPLVALLLLFDLPCVLAGELWQTIRDGLAPGTMSPLVAWKDFLQHGGRYALGFAAALAVILATRRTRHAAN